MDVGHFGGAGGNFRSRYFLLSDVSDEGNVTDSAADNVSSDDDDVADSPSDVLCNVSVD